MRRHHRSRSLNASDRSRPGSLTWPLLSHRSRGQRCRTPPPLPSLSARRQQTSHGETHASSQPPQNGHCAQDYQFINVASASQVEHEADDCCRDACAEAHADHQHLVPSEVALKAERHLDDEIGDEHFDGQPCDVPSDDDLVELRQHGCHIHQTNHPDDTFPTDLLGEFLTSQMRILHIWTIQSISIY